MAARFTGFAALNTALFVGLVSTTDGGGVTVKLIVVVCAKLPDVPVMVTVPMPGVALVAAVRVTALVPVVGDGLNDAVTPLGNPEADRFTLPVNPFKSLAVIVLVPLSPCAMERMLGLADKLKSELFSKRIALY